MKPCSWVGFLHHSFCSHSEAQLPSRAPKGGSGAGPHFVLLSYLTSFPKPRWSCGLARKSLLKQMLKGMWLLDAIQKKAGIFEEGVYQVRDKGSLPLPGFLCDWCQPPSQTLGPFETTSGRTSRNVRPPHWVHLSTLLWGCWWSGDWEWQLSLLLLPPQ